MCSHTSSLSQKGPHPLISMRGGGGSPLSSLLSPPAPPGIPPGVMVGKSACGTYSAGGPGASTVDLTVSDFSFRMEIF